MKFIFVLLFLFPTSGLTEIVDVTIRGASRVDRTGTPIVIYAGTAGDASQYIENGDGTVDNCISRNVLRACNQRRILSKNDLEIQFRSTSHRGEAVIADEDGVPIRNDSTRNFSTNERAIVTVTWHDICNAMDPSQRFCQTYSNNQNQKFDETKTFYIGINAENEENPNDNELDTNDDRLQIQIKVQSTMEDVVNRCPDPDTESQFAGGNGVCDFTIFPGDGKVYLQNIQVHNDFPNSTNGIQFENVLLFLEPTQNGSCANASSITNSSPFSKQAIETDNETHNIRNNSFEKFIYNNNNEYLIRNDTEYVFKVAVEDQAGNIGLFTHDDLCKDGDIRNSHIQTPSLVYGALPKDLKCFIATATYGSVFEKHVTLLRLFRDKILNQTQWGQQFIQFYYKTSPPLAQLIRNSEILKTLFKLLLTPILIFAWLSLKIGIAQATCCLLLFFLTLFKITSMLKVRQRL